MNVIELIRELELAAWEMAEATSRENAARNLRRNAGKRISAVHANFTDALRLANQTRKKTSQNNATE